MDHPKIMHLLESCEFFKELRHRDIQEITDLCRLEGYAAGEHIFRQGDFGEQIYIVAEGHVFLERSMDLGIRKGSAVIGMLGKGRVFGGWSTLLNERHILMSSAVCRKPTKVLVMKGSDLRGVMLANNELGFNVLERLCYLLRDRLMCAYEAMEGI
jgi:CRP-like cAMP-binding protein